ncbi:MAG TPA: hypothetical protein PKM23_14685, partial [bacterium]|nr:hypothetical protein [bacterium]
PIFKKFQEKLALLHNGGIQIFGVSSEFLCRIPLNLVSPDIMRHVPQSLHSISRILAAWVMVNHATFLNMLFSPVDHYSLFIYIRVGPRLRGAA